MCKKNLTACLHLTTAEEFVRLARMEEDRLVQSQCDICGSASMVSDEEEEEEEGAAPSR